MEKRATVFDIVKEQYSDCQVIDTGRSTLLIPPGDGRYGELALEVPTPRLPALHYYDERIFRREVLSQMDGLTRALPDIGRQTLNALKFSERTRGTAWAGIHLETFLRFGMITKVHGEQVALKIVPPRYATDTQIILRTRSNAQLEGLIELIRQNEEYSFQEWTCSYRRVQGYNHIFGVVGIARDMVEIRDQMEYYWRLVNGVCSDFREQRQYVNNWLSGVDLR